MTTIEQRLEELYAHDARAWKVRRVGVPRRPLGWVGGAAFITTTTAVSVLTIAILSAVVSTRGPVGAPGAITTSSPGASRAPGIGAPGAALASDSRSVLLGGRPVLTIDDDQIVQWFRSKSQLCDARNIGSTPDRRQFCTDVGTFRSKTRFASVAASPDGTVIGFTIESDALTPDTAAGIFFRSSGSVTFLTGYYLGNRFLSFSPGGAHFAYQGDCFEAKCGLYVRDSGTLAEKLRVNGPAAGTERTQNATFVRWISDHEIEYTLGGQPRTASF